MGKVLNLKKIECSNCGAELIYDPQTQMTNCNFCGSTFEIEKAVDHDFITPDGIVPFTVTHDEFKQAVLRWLCEGDYTPDDILTSSAFEKANGLYLPLFWYQGTYNGNWSASCGYNRKEHYEEWDNSQNKIVKKTRFVTDWSPASGDVSGNFSVLGFAGAGDGIKSEIASYAHEMTWERGGVKDYDSKYSLGFNLLSFTKSAQEVWDEFGQAQANEIAAPHIRSKIPGDTFKHLAYDLQYEWGVATQIYVPSWVVYYKYGENEFHICMDGTNISRISGQRPEDEERRQATEQLIMYPTLALIIWLGTMGPTYWFLDVSLGDYYWPTFFAGLAGVGAFFAYGVRKRNELINESKLKRQKALEGFLDQHMD